jgi:hypothetical protein
MFIIINNHIISTDEDPGLRIESFAVINLRGVSTNKTIICFIAMQTYKELNMNKVVTIVLKSLIIQKKYILILYLEIRGRLQPFFVNFELDFLLKY